MVVVVEEPVTDTPEHPEQLGEATTVYPVIGDPPLLVGALHERFTLGPLTLATGVPGADGTTTPKVEL